MAPAWGLLLYQGCGGPMRTLRFEPSAAQRCETTPEHSDGGPEGVTSEARNNPSLSAISIYMPLKYLALLYLIYLQTPR